MSNKQLQYNQAIDNLTYLVLNYPKPVQELLAKSNVFFKGKPSNEQLINEVVELLKDGDSAFAKALESLIQQFSSQENDQFWGAIAKGAVSVIGGLFKKKKRRRSSGGSNGAARAAQARAAAQARSAKRDMERRMRKMREEQERRRREAEERRRREEERRRREAEAKKKADAAKKKTNMMLMIGGGVVVLGLGAVVLMKSGRPQMPYGQPPMQIPK